MNQWEEPETDATPTLFKVAVVDIGSNSVRVVVYNGFDRFAIPVFNEKVLCGLGRGLGQSGRLNPEGREMAKEVASRYIQILKGLQVEKTHVLATAAIRDAKDGAEFVRELENGGRDRLGFKRNLSVPINVISGDEEARLAAQGVIYSIYNPSGVAGDLGGGSLELINFTNGRPGDRCSLPLGHFRLIDACDEDAEEAVKFTEKSLKKTDFVKKLHGRDFFAVGGGFRTLAKMLITENKFPVRVLHNYRTNPEAALKLCNRLLSVKKVNAADFPGLVSEREDTIQYSAAVLKSIIELGEPDGIVFSAAGVREGYLFSLLSEKERMVDPLVASSAYLAKVSGCNMEYGYALHKWLKKALPDVAANYGRLLAAVAILSEIGWAEHPEYRSEFAFDRAIEYPLIGIEHSERVMLALALYHRHKTKLRTYFADIADTVLSKEGIKLATIMGLCVAIAGKISRGGVLPLSQVALTVSQKKIVVEEKECGGFAYLEGDALRKLKKLATYLDLPIEAVEKSKLV